MQPLDKKKNIFAGPYKGLHGLAGPCSRLFFVFLNQAVRFLAENVASMLEMHYRAFCRLLNIDLTPPDKYLWNLSDIGYQIARRRNFFRNFDDVEGIPSPTLIFGDHFGPLLRQNGEMIPLGIRFPTESCGRLGHYISHMHWFGTMPFGMARPTSPKK